MNSATRSRVPDAPELRHHEHSGLNTASRQVVVDGRLAEGRSNKIKSASMRTAVCTAAIVLVTQAVAAAPDFSRDIQPILTTRCVNCHGAKLQMHGLRLDRKADALKGGESGLPAVVPGKSAQSLLFKYVSANS